MLNIIKKPLITEKSFSQSDKGNTYSFVVDLKADKTEIKKAVQELFKVKVSTVRTSVCRGKFFRKSIKFGPPKTWKKATVKLAPGEKISIFEGA